MNSSSWAGTEARANAGGDGFVATAGSSKSDYAYTRIREAIVAGKFGPGYRLVISTLARDLGVSAQPVREAIRRLEAGGWVQYERNVGAQVAEFDSSHWIDGMHLLAVLDGYATACAAANIRPETLERAAVVNDQMEAAVARMDLIAAMQLNRAFHEVLLERCGNRMLVLAVRDTWDRLDNMQRSHGFYGGVAQESVAEHRELLTLLAKEPEHEPIERFCRNHLLRVVDAYVASTDRVGLSSVGRG